MKKIIVLIIMSAIPSMAFAKDSWEMQMHKWLVKSASNRNCQVWYTTGIYRPDTGTVWGVMTEKMFKWFSTKGQKIAPSACAVGSANVEKAKYRILFAETPMRTQTQTIHGTETQTQITPTRATVNARTTYEDGSSSTTTGTINGTETTTVVVPTETTYTQSSAAAYMYTYRVDAKPWRLIAADDVGYERVGVRGNGQDAAYAEMGAGIGNLIRASKDRHRADKLYESAMEAIAADSSPVNR